MDFESACTVCTHAGYRFALLLRIPLLRSLLQATNRLQEDRVVVSLEKLSLRERQPTDRCVCDALLRLLLLSDGETETSSRVMHVERTSS